MLRACYLLRDTVNKIGRMGKSLSANSDLDVLRNRLRFEYRNALVLFNELTSCTDDYRVDSSLNDFIGTVDSVLIEEDWSIIKQNLEELPKITLGDYIDDLSEYDLEFIPKQTDL